MKRHLVFVFMLSLGCLHAQEKKYFVLMSTGDVWIRSGNHPAIRAKAKQVLAGKEIIELRNDQSEIAIANAAGYYFDWREKGSHTMEDVSKMEKTRSPGITPKFLSYLYEEMLHPKNSNKLTHESVAASWGAGSRGNSCQTMKSPLDDAITSKDTMEFKWSHNNKLLAYNFILYDADGGQVFNCIVRDTQLIVRMAQLRKGEEEKYAWSVSSVDNKCPLYKSSFRLVTSKEESKRIDKLLKDHDSNPNEVLNNLEIADLLGKNGYYDKAIEYYNKAKLMIGK
jgi:hypothetical protein